MDVHAVAHPGVANAVATWRQVSFRLTRATKKQWRARTAAIRSLPSFIIIGAQRSGTTSLYNWITSHPDVAPASQKELHYFDGRNYEKGEKWYRAQFPLATDRRMTCESTPQMLYNPTAPARVEADLPGSTKFVVLLRNPVERALSHYWMSKGNGAEKEDLETALALEPVRLAQEEEAFQAGRYSYAHHKFSYAARGEYASQLTRWFSSIDQQRVLVLESESLFSDRDMQLQLTNWLGLAPLANPIPALNSAKRSDVKPEVVTRLQQHFEPMNRQLFELLGRPLWNH
jgi:hypothetical protein